MTRLAGVVALAAFMIPIPVTAHHGWSEYDSAKALKLTGKIVESGYEQPPRAHPVRGQGRQ